MKTSPGTRQRRRHSAPSTPDKTLARAAPTVLNTTPANGAINIAADANIGITFSESVNATASAFSIECPTGTLKTFTQSASPATTFTLDPTVNLPFSTVCTVTVSATQITDQDVSDPPDQMAANCVLVHCRRRSAGRGRECDH